MALTWAQQYLLECATEKRLDEYEGRLCIRGPRLRAANTLVELGLFSYEGTGPMEDDPNPDAERHMFKITEAGRQWLKDHQGAKCETLPS